MKIYMMVTKDELELPLAVADSAQELARITRKSSACILSALAHGYKGWARVEVEDDNENQEKRV